MLFISFKVDNYVIKCILDIPVFSVKFCDPADPAVYK